MVCWERTPFSYAARSRPDVIGVTRASKVIEVEVKVTVADFRANALKRGIVDRQRGYALDYPERFYFIVTPDMVDKIAGEVPEYAGLLPVEKASQWSGVPEVTVVKRAVIDHRAKVLTRYQMGRMLMHQTGTLVRLASLLSRVGPEDVTHDWMI